MELFRKFKYPTNVFWEITPQCNHNCIHCFNYWRSDLEETCKIDNTTQDIDYLTLAKRIIDTHPLRVVITGGEPLLIWDRIRPCISLFIENGIGVSMNSNATLITDEIASFLYSNKITLLVSYPCDDASICDFITDTAGSRDKIVHGLDILHKNKVYFSCNMVVSTINIGHMEQTVAFLKERYDLSKISLSRVGKPVNAGTEFDKYLLQSDDIRRLIEESVALSKKYNIAIDASSPYPVCALESQDEFDMFAGNRLCSAGKSTFVVGSDGSVKACPRDNTIYGNLYTEAFDDVWEAMAEWRDVSSYPKECRECNFFPKCLGGCRAESVALNGNCKGLDSAADLDKLPLQFKQSLPEIIHFEMNNVFEIPKGISWLEDYDGYRMAYLGDYSMVQKEVYYYFTKVTRFTLQEFMEHFKVSEPEANQILNILLNKRFINVLHDE